MHGIPWSLEHRLDRTVRAIPDPSGQSNLDRLLAAFRPEVHALHLAGYHGANPDRLVLLFIVHYIDVLNDT